jgi:hypothetical protein
MSEPVSRPSKDDFRPHHRTTQIDPVREPAPGGRPFATTIAFRQTGHRRRANAHMPGRQQSSRASKKMHKGVASGHRTCSRARLIGSTCAIHLSCRNSGETNFGTFRTPYRSVPVPHRSWRASKSGAGSNNGGSSKKKQHISTVAVPSAAATGCGCNE